MPSQLGVGYVASSRRHVRNPPVGRVRIEPFVGSVEEVTEHVQDLMDLISKEQKAGNGAPEWLLVLDENRPRSSAEDVEAAHHEMHDLVQAVEESMGRGVRVAKSTDVGLGTSLLDVSRECVLRGSAFYAEHSKRGSRGYDIYVATVRSCGARPGVVTFVGHAWGSAGGYPFRIVRDSYLQEARKRGASGIGPFPRFLDVAVHRGLPEYVLARQVELDEHAVAAELAMMRDGLDVCRSTSLLEVVGGTTPFNFLDPAGERKPFTWLFDGGAVERSGRVVACFMGDAYTSNNPLLPSCGVARVMGKVRHRVTGGLAALRAAMEIVKRHAEKSGRGFAKSAAYHHPSIHVRDNSAHNEVVADVRWSDLVGVMIPDSSFLSQKHRKALAAILTLSLPGIPCYAMVESRSGWDLRLVGSPVAYPTERSGRGDRRWA